MANFGAHLNQATTTGANPSIFDLVAQDSLTSSLKPALEYIWKILLAKNPDRWFSSWNFSNEFLFSLLGIAESYYLWKKSASFSEHFYGLERTCKINPVDLDNVPSLSNRRKIFSLLFLIGIPYCQAKLNTIYEHMKERQENFQCYQSGTILKRQIVKKIFYTSYPYFYAVKESISFLTYLAYILKFSRVHSLSLLLLGVQLKYTNHQLNDQSINPLQVSPNIENRFVWWIIKISKIFLATSSFLIETAFPVGVFFLQFLQWWYESDNNFQKTTVSLPIPPPPNNIKIEDTASRLPPHPSQCPLCQQVHRNPTALLISGYVFCYSCIYKYVDKHNSCPLTNVPCSLDHLIKLYTN